MNREHLITMSYQSTVFSDVPKCSLNSIEPLISDDRDSSNGWYTKFQSFTSGDVEVIAIKLDAEQSIKKGGGAKRENKSKPEMSQSVLKKSQARAKKQVRHKAMMMNSDRMLTLTYKANMQDLSKAWADLKAFNRIMKKRYKDKWKYIAVPEFQKRGAVHFHMAISGYFDVNYVRSIWRSVVGEGNIDITSPGKIDKNTWNPKRIAQYLAKYISKTDSVEFNKRRYSSSMIEPPATLTGWLPLSAGIPVESLITSIVNRFSKKSVTDIVSIPDCYFPLIFVST